MKITKRDMSMGFVWPHTVASAGVRFLLRRGKRIPKKSFSFQVLTKDSFDAPPENGVRATWLGHSTVIVEIDGGRVLCDPMWSERSSPVKGTGPRRFFPVPLKIEDLPSLDAVLFSHDHYDHLDRDTALRLAEVGAPFLTPNGVGKRIKEWGVPGDLIHELGWGDSMAIGRLNLVCAPARHFSGRGLTDRNRTDWCSWVIRGREHRVFFGGDGGPGPHFDKIGSEYGPFDLTMLEIGAWDKAWGDIHLGPHGAIEAHKALRGKILLPIHWGTFNLALHDWFEPAEGLNSLAESSSIQVAFVKPGQSVTVGGRLPKDLWWREYV